MKKFILIGVMLGCANMASAQVLSHQETKVLLTHEQIRTKLIPEEYATIIEDFEPEKLEVQLDEQTSMVARYERVERLRGAYFIASVVWTYTVTYDGMPQACPGDKDNSLKGQCQVRQGSHIFQRDRPPTLPPWKQPEPTDSTIITASL